MRSLPLVALLLLTILPAQAKSLRKPQTLPVAESVQDTLHAGGAVLTFDIADDDQERTHGLSGRTSLDWNHGLLFVFPDDSRRSFWMIDCHFDLDIAYLSADGTIRDIQTMVVQPGAAPRDLRRYPSATSDIRYALEVNRGWFADRGLEVGMRLPAVARHHTER